MFAKLNNDVKAIFSDKVVQICIIICSLIFGLVNVQQGYKSNAIVDNMQRGGAYAICYYLLLNFAYYIFTRDYKFIFSKIKSFPKLIRKDFSWIIAFICAALCIFNFWLFYPGYITHDWAYVMTKLPLNNHAPVIYPFLLSKIYRIFGMHIYFPLLFNLIPFYFGVYAVVLGLWHRFQSKWCLLVFLIIGIENIFFYNMQLHSSFSSPMFIFLLWAIVLYQVLNGVTRKNIIFAIVAYFFAVLSRHNALIQAYPVCFIYAYWIVMKLKSSFRKCKYIGLLLSFAVLTLLISRGLPKLIEDNHFFVSNHIFLHQIAGSCVPNNDANCFQDDWYEVGKTFSDVKKAYEGNLLYADIMNMPWEKERPFKYEYLTNLQSKWIESIIKYPNSYILHLTRYIEIMWKQNIASPLLLHKIHCMSEADCEWMKKYFSGRELFYQVPLCKKEILKSLYKIFYQVKTLHYIIFNYILCIIFFILFIKNENILSLYILSSSFTAIASSIIFCIFSPVPAPRYMYPVLISSVMTIVATAIYLIENKIKIKHFCNKKMVISMGTIILLSFMCNLYLHRHDTVARIDISTPLVNADEPQFEVYVDESETSEKQIDWMYKMNRQGYVIQKTDQEMNISIKALNNIEISIELRGPDVRDENGKIIENWVKYNSVTINGEEILNAPVVTWHSKPVVAYIISAKANNEYKIHVAWTKTDM